MIVAIVVLSCALVFSLGWIMYKKPTQPNLLADEKKLASGFEQKKADESKRIDSEDRNALLSDLNHP